MRYDRATGLRFRSQLLLEADGDRTMTTAGSTAGATFEELAHPLPDGVVPRTEECKKYVRMAHFAHPHPFMYSRHAQCILHFFTCVAYRVCAFLIHLKSAQNHSLICR